MSDDLRTEEEVAASVSARLADVDDSDVAGQWCLCAARVVYRHNIRAGGTCTKEPTIQANNSIASFSSSRALQVFILLNKIKEIRDTLWQRVWCTHFHTSDILWRQVWYTNFQKWDTVTASAVYSPSDMGHRDSKWDVLTFRHGTLTASVMYSP